MGGIHIFQRAIDPKDHWSEFYFIIFFLVVVNVDGVIISKTLPLQQFLKPVQKVFCSISRSWSKRETDVHGDGMDSGVQVEYMG